MSAPVREPAVTGDAPGSNGTAGQESVGTSERALADRVVGDRALSWWLSIAGVVGLVAAATLLVERIKLLQDPSYVPSCSINPVLSCGSVMVTDQASVLGFPNPVLGVAAFPMLLVTGVGVLAGARFARWYWAGVELGAVVGLGFVAWLIFQSLYRIGALCPYCMVVWAVVIPTFWYVTLRNLEAGVFGARVARSRVVRFLTDWHAPLLLLAFAAVVGLVGEQFWSYWSTLL